MTTLALLLALATSLFALCMGALALQRALGWGPLMLVMGALEGLKIFVLTPTVIDFPGVGAMRLGSVLSYMNALTVVQVVYLRGGLGAARQLVWTLAGVSAAFALLGPLLTNLLSAPEIRQPLHIDVEVLNSSARVEAIGNGLLIIGLSASVLLVNAFQRLNWGRWLSLFLTLLIVSAVDSVLFIAFALGSEIFTFHMVLSAVQGKSLMAVAFASLAWLSLVILRRDHGEPRTVLPGRELLAFLSFQRQLGQIEAQLLRDPLTEVYNRRYLEQVVPDLLHLDQMRQLPTSLVLVHVRSVGVANETYGRAVGDRVLAHAARCLELAVRRNDVVIRDHGATFVVVLPGTLGADAMQAAQQVLERLKAQPIALAKGAPIEVDACAGLAVAPDDGDDLGSLLVTARQRLEMARSDGAGQVVGLLG
ncbi:GGDEF domain-containing protein [Inhella gelatinilytica]|uniref:GGDEF domain-containing protein n=1 Tax=Inhella gelatinilytica TaxID=2795030 RepID=A0A931IY85_9BURK|nr:GGDEF domain-containing protein [Inhella gelatinilytica]MBH9552203.1 GGDEF domain-containing protein [Inhella gelatinilytica]